MYKYLISWKLKLYRPDASLGDKSVSYNGKGVSKMGTDDVMWMKTLNTTWLASPNTLPSQFKTNTYAHTHCLWLELKTEAPEVLLLIKIILTLSALPSHLLQLVSKNMPFVFHNILANHKEWGKSATLLQQTAHDIIRGRWLCTLDVSSFLHFITAFMKHSNRHTWTLVI